MNKLSDCWQTPQWLFDQLNEQHGPFDIDLCASLLNFKVRALIDDSSADVRDYLKTPLDKYLTRGSIFFMNPPYSNPRPFIEKAWEDSKYCKIVCLVKCDPSTKWWATFWNYENILGETLCVWCRKGKGRNGTNDYTTPCEFCLGTGKNFNVLIEGAGPKPGCQVLFLPKRVQFDPPQELIDSGEVWAECSKCKLGYYQDSNVGENVFNTEAGCIQCGNNKFNWVQKCTCTKESLCYNCDGYGYTVVQEDHYRRYNIPCRVCEGNNIRNCVKCKGKGYIKLSGPTFPSAVVIMDRKGI